jgi:hypothetical protein
VRRNRSCELTGSALTIIWKKVIQKSFDVSSFIDMNNSIASESNHSSESQAHLAARFLIEEKSRTAVNPSS